jgi:hypothetical protein
VKRIFITQIAAFWLAIAGGLSAAVADELAVDITNLSQPVRCAEEDNVTLMLTSPTVRQFRIEATHPAYLAALREDNWAADWTACNFGPAVEGATSGGTQTPASSGTKANTEVVRLPQRETIYEAVDRWLVALRFPNFWREATANVRVGDKTFKGVHLLQLWRVRPNGGEEVLVMYPQDGYWRARPLAPKGRDLTAFGSSFLIGPVEEIGRPVVRLKEIAYDPKLEGFQLSFAAGGSARVKLAEVSASRLALDVTLSGVSEGKGFAALRSMYVTGTNNDVADVAMREANGSGWREARILELKGGGAVELWAGRRAISQHNTSSPDMSFKWFRK